MTVIYQTTITRIGASALTPSATDAHHLSLKARQRTSKSIASFIATAS